MPSVSGAIPNLIGGISQQPSAARLENTAEDLKNAIPSVVSGLRKRPPMRYAADLMAAPESSIGQFTLDRPNKPVKIITVADGSLKVFDESGAEEFVTSNPYLSDYLICDDPKRDIGFVSVADTVFIYNKTKVVAVSQPIEYRGDPADQFSVHIENTATHVDWYMTVFLGETEVQTAAFTRTNGDDVDDIAESLMTTFNAAGALVATRTGNVIHIPADPSFDRIEVGPASLTKAYRTQVDKFSSLPPYEKDGRILKIDSTERENSTSAFHVSFERDTGLWTETFGYNAEEVLDVTTMPLSLKDDGDGTWTLDTLSWGGRAVGDADSNRTPSFVGSPISFMFLKNNRMFILADEYLIASEQDKYTNFYRTTCTTLLETDRIDIASGSTDGRLSLLSHAVDFDDGVLIFSDRNQYKMDTRSGISTKDVNLHSVGSFSASPKVQPRKIDNYVLFVEDETNSSWTQIREYTIDAVVGTHTSEVVTQQVPEFIPAGVYSLETNQTLGLSLVLSDGAPDKIFAYSSYTSNGQRIQSAWCYWESSNTEFVSTDFVGNKLYITMLRDGMLVLAYVDLQETLEGDVNGLEVLLDYRLHNPAITYDGTKSVVTLPYNCLEGEEYVAVVAVAGEAGPAGTVYDVTSFSGNEAYIEGIDISGHTVFFGKRYEFSYRLSPVYLRDEGKVPVQDGRLQLLYLSFLYHQSSYFQVKVQPIGRREFISTFTGRFYGEQGNTFGAVPSGAGEFRVPVSSRADQLNVTVVNPSPFNCRFSSIEWNGLWRPKRKRLR